jgi:hypothetical protein
MKLPFRKSKVHNLETTIASLTKRGEQLAAKRAVAQDALDKAIKIRLDAHLSGDLDDQRALDQLQATANAAASALAGIDDALAVLGQQQAEAERQLAAERDRVERAVAADKLDKQVAAIEAVLPDYLARSRALADALSEIGHWHFESGQMSGFLQNTIGQIEVAANFTLAELKAMPEAIRQGRQAIPSYKPGPAPTEQVGKVVPHIKPDPVMREANFTVIDRSAEARTIPIEALRT